MNSFSYNCDVLVRFNLKFVGMFVNANRKIHHQQTLRIISHSSSPRIHFLHVSVLRGKHVILYHQETPRNHKVSKITNYFGNYLTLIHQQMQIPTFTSSSLSCHSFQKYSNMKLNKSVIKQSGHHLGTIDVVSIVAKRCLGNNNPYHYLAIRHWRVVLVTGHMDPGSSIG